MKKLLILLFIISLSARLYFLFFGFSSITNDEADYYLTSSVVAKTGSDQFGNIFFLSSGFLNAISSVPVYIGVLFLKIIPLTGVVFARLPFALLNSLTPVLLFSLVYFFSKNIIFSLFGFAVMCFSPWFSHLSATAAFDSPISLFFFLAATTSFCYIKKPLWLKYGLSILCSFLAFNSYMGFKIIFPFLLVSFLLLYFYSLKKKVSAKQVLFSILLASGIFISFFIISLKGPGGTLFTDRAAKTIVFFDKAKIDNEIWYANLTTTGRVVRKLFNNYAVTSFQMFLSKYANALNPAIYFFGEQHVIYGLRIMGLFFVTDIIFFAIGIFYGLQLLNKQMRAMLFCLFIIGPIPTALQIEGLSVALRGIFLLPAISLVIASGYLALIKSIRNRYFYAVLILLFIGNYISFLGLYQYRIKTLSSEAWSSTQKMVLEDLYKYKGSKMHMYVNGEKGFFMKYGIYNKMVNPESFKKQLMLPSVSKYSDDNLTIHFSCKDALNKTDTGYFVFDTGKCPTQYNLLSKSFKMIKEYPAQDKTGEILYVLVKKI